VDSICSVFVLSTYIVTVYQTYETCVCVV